MYNYKWFVVVRRILRTAHHLHDVTMEVPLAYDAEQTRFCEKQVDARPVGRYDMRPSQIITDEYHKKNISLLKCI